MCLQALQIQSKWQFLKNDTKCGLINKKNIAEAYKYTSENSITNTFFPFKWLYKIELAG